MFKFETFKKRFPQMEGKLFYILFSNSSINSLLYKFFSIGLSFVANISKMSHKLSCAKPWSLYSLSGC